MSRTHVHTTCARVGGIYRIRSKNFSIHLERCQATHITIDDEFHHSNISSDMQEMICRDISCLHGRDLQRSPTTLRDKTIQEVNNRHENRLHVDRLHLRRESQGTGARCVHISTLLALTRGKGWHFMYRSRILLCTIKLCS